MRNRISVSLRRNWRRVATVGVATVGVVVLSAGAGYTASMVGSAQIKNGSIRQIDIGAGGVSGVAGQGDSEIAPWSVGQKNIARGGVDQTEVENGSLGWRDLHPNSIGPGRLIPSLREKIEKGGEKGEDGVSGYGLLSNEIELDESTETVTAKCAEGKVAIGGGFQIGGAHRDQVDIRTSGPVVKDDRDGTFSANTWEVVAAHTGTPGNNNPTVKSYVLCAKVN